MDLPLGGDIQHVALCRQQPSYTRGTLRLFWGALSLGNGGGGDDKRRQDDNDRYTRERDRLQSGAAYWSPIPPANWLRITATGRPALCGALTIGALHVAD